MDGQDLTPAEQEKLREIRETLIQEGYFQSEEDITTQSASVESIITHSTYTGKNLSVSASTNDARASDFRPNGSREATVG